MLLVVLKKNQIVISPSEFSGYKVAKIIVMIKQKELLEVLKHVA